ncbi:hypothetical protein QJS10_CPA08g00313 [Acorus calamus]|uniref:rhamnogalacturonan endolyase n=1 Tax=Acorus calamus TaxID=4465 RepID=A0AAV9EDA1_ACOCL|nr:hypothetical protein QJS10_CPA08g00313 [Acorus calamus]
MPGTKVNKATIDVEAIHEKDLIRGVAATNPPTAVRLDIQDQHVVMDNGILQVTLSKPDGIITGVRYNGIDNLMEIINKEDNRGYWDVVWAEPGRKGNIFDTLKATGFKVILQNENQVELSFTRTWNVSQKGTVIPLNIDKRFIMLRGNSGFYTYAIYEHLRGWPDFDLEETRVAFKLRKDKFQYMAIADNRQRKMPMPDDRMAPRGQELAYPEAFRLINPIDPNMKGEVDDKYQYSCNNEDNKVHGWICTNPLIGFWQITPSDEFRTGGPVKQDLTSHVGPTMLAKLEVGRIISRPQMIFQRRINEVRLVADYLFVTGTLMEQTSQPNQHTSALPYQVTLDHGKENARATNSGLKPNADGSFSIANIHTGNYNLYAWVPGFIGDYKYNTIITINPGSAINVGNLVYEPPRDGPTLWEIGIPDRSAAEFFVPDPNPMYINKLYINHPDRFRQYGLWERYAELYPNGDLVYTVGKSDFRKDWFFAHVTRLRLALASATLSELQKPFDQTQDSFGFPPVDL